MGIRQLALAGGFCFVAAGAAGAAAAQESVIRDIGFSVDAGTQVLYGEFDSELPAENVFLIAAVVRGAYEVETRSDLIDRIALELEAMTGVNEGDVDASTGADIFQVDFEADVRLDYSFGAFAVLHADYSENWGAHFRAGLNYAATSVTIRSTLGTEEETEETSFAPVIGTGLRRRLGKSSSLRFDLGYYWLADEYVAAGLAFSHRF
ncbi:MAG: hypothetical protein AAFR11_12160 [Pseudomonadota bacterium]